MRPSGVDIVNRITTVDCAYLDSELLTRVQEKDEDALTELYRRFGGLIFTVALRVVGDKALAEEIMQDTFLRCWTRAETFDPGRASVGPWLAGIARNRSIDLLRSGQHQARLRERVPLDPGRFPRFSTEIDQVLARKDVGQALEQLSPGQRQVIEMAYYGGLTQQEIARLLGVPLGTIKSRTRLAMNQLRDALQSYMTSATETGESS